MAYSVDGHQDIHHYDPKDDNEAKS
jgi:hypothetical protein